MWCGVVVVIVVGSGGGGGSSSETMLPLEEFCVEGVLAQLVAGEPQAGVGTVGKQGNTKATIETE